MRKIRIAIAGASGYAGAELVRLAASHPVFELASMERAIQLADIVVLLVDHKPFRRLRAADFKDKILISYYMGEVTPR